MFASVAGHLLVIAVTASFNMSGSTAQSLETEHPTPPLALFTRELLWFR
jgi:hypothetical protein